MRLQAHHTPPSGRVYHAHGLSLRLLRRCLRITNFLELRKSEVQLRRITILGTSVNRAICRACLVTFIIYHRRGGASLCAEGCHGLWHTRDRRYGGLFSRRSTKVAHRRVLPCRRHPSGLEVAPEPLQAEPHPPFHRAERQPQEISYLHVRVAGEVC